MAFLLLVTIFKKSIFEFYFLPAFSAMLTAILNVLSQSASIVIQSTQ